MDKVILWCETAPIGWVIIAWLIVMHVLRFMG